MEENKNDHKNAAVWEYETTDPAKAGLLKDALRSIKDPEIGLSVIELGLIRNVVFTDERLMITMILTTPFCPYAPAMINQVRDCAEQTLGITAAVDYRMDMWDESMMEEGCELDWGLY